MNDLEKLTNALYEFILFELGRCEEEYKNSLYAYYSFKSVFNMCAVIVAWVEKEYFKKMSRRLLEYIKYFSA